MALIKLIFRAMAAIGLCACVWPVVAFAQNGVGQVTFVSGLALASDAKAASRQLVVGDTVHAGEKIQTQDASYLHLRMVDDGFVALRPNSTLVLSVYEYRPDQPQSSKIRIDLQHGTSRSVTGKGGQAAKHQYRFNTPLAAIGIRGTDYTVFAKADLTRVSVADGAIVISPFGEGCDPGLLGPCSTSLSRELTSALSNVVMEVTPGNKTPRALEGVVSKASDMGVGGKASANLPLAQFPPSLPSAVPADPASMSLLDQSVKSVVASSSVLPLVPQDSSITVVPVVPVAPPPSPATEPAIPQTPVDHQSIARWGRWSALVAQIPEGSRSIAQVFNPMQSYTIDAVNAAMTLAHPVAAAIQLPTQGAVSFALIAGEAYVKREAEFNTAAVKSGQLEIDFTKSTFSTQLKVATSPGSLETVLGQGDVSRYGRMQSQPAQSNAQIQGVVLSKGLEATYLFDKRLANGTQLLGAVQWSR